MGRVIAWLSSMVGALSCVVVIAGISLLVAKPGRSQTGGSSSYGFGCLVHKTNCPSYGCLGFLYCATPNATNTDKYCDCVTTPPS